MIIDQPEQIELYRMHVLHKMLKLELLGIKGNKQKVLDKVNEIIQVMKEQKGEINGCL